MKINVYMKNNNIHIFCDKPIACNSEHNLHHKKLHEEFSNIGHKNATCTAHFFSFAQPAAKWRDLPRQTSAKRSNAKTEGKGNIAS